MRVSGLVISSPSGSGSGYVSERVGSGSMNGVRPVVSCYAGGDVSGKMSCC